MHGITESDAVGTVGFDAWHRLGTRLQDGETVREAFPRIMPWDVEARPAYFQEPAPTPIYAEAPGQVIVRVDRHGGGVTPLSVVGPRYRPIRNAVLQDIGEALETTGMRLASIGSHGGGAKVWLLLSVPSVPGFHIGGSEHRPYLALLNSHDGTTAFVLTGTEVRVQCANTFRLTMSESKKNAAAVSIRHTADAEAVADRIADAATSFAMAVDSRRNAYLALTERSILPGMRSTYFDVMAAEMHPIPEDPDLADEDRRKVMTRRAATLRQLQETDAKAILRDESKTYRETAYGALQSFTEWYDNRGKGAGPLARLSDSNGRGTVKARALEVASIMAG